ncbi:Crp/Fnr family transcriptional regulator [Oscillatoria salina]|uniref:Crp/Fnr family transcriptional regulator n=1 Tax=Oscillatoria salina TaxID=331517 RepID=UPI0013B5F11C|nr:Crp/Fnr family transcriptional regulator [Oscillatoria salina]MBZ8180345.1 Crp/Fnr family transcriptional regulator [Oscillatoria salina IIICB1]NET88623.1 Crp/Fnr family transcriptional regulator [Kamptonema sp. SIO1D9]
MNQFLNKRPINQILAALPESEYDRLLPYLEFVELSVGQVLYNPQENITQVYFPDRGIVSLVYILEDGATAEVGLIGKEGVVGLPVILGGNSTINQAIVQIEGSAYKIDAIRLKNEFDRGGKLQQMLLLYTQALLTQISQTAVCNAQHTIEERLARWLLTVQELLDTTEELPLTQEFISNMLGTRRSGVTVAAGRLQAAGTISYRRGKITILNQEELELIACECYQILKDEFRRLLSFECD